MAAVAQNKIQRICYLGNIRAQRGRLELELPEFEWQENPKNSLIKAIDIQTKQYFSGKRKSFDLPLEFHGTDFQKTVWTGLMRVPYGDLLSYGDLASFIDKPKAARAVGGAVAVCNHLIFVPCHRVIAGDGTIGGFGCNLHVKRLLLKVEGHEL
jgi:methylated-DNA-[protein]-cysteine S-methyltransferase